MNVANAETDLAELLIDNTGDPRIAPYFTKAAQHQRDKTKVDWWRVIRNGFLRSVAPYYIGEYRAYVQWRGSKIQWLKARRIFWKMFVLISAAASLLSFIFYIQPERAEWPERANFLITLMTWWVLNNIGMNFFSAYRFEKPDFRNYRLRFRPDERKRIMAELQFKLTGKDQIAKIREAGNVVDFLHCDATIPITEFPDNFENAGVIGTEAKEWKWLEVTEDNSEKHDAIFGDEYYGKKNFLKTLVRAKFGDVRTGLICMDGNPGAGFSFAEYADLPNAAIALGIAKAHVALKLLWEEMHTRTSERRLNSLRKWPRLVVLIDENLSLGVFNFWRKSFRAKYGDAILTATHILLRELVDNGKLYNIHFIAVLDNTKLDMDAWMTMRTRFEAYAVYWNREIKTKDKDKGTEKTKTVETIPLPYRDVVGILWGAGKVLFKAPRFDDEHFFAFMHEMAKTCDERNRNLLSAIRMAKVPEI